MLSFDNIIKVNYFIQFIVYFKEYCF